MTDEKGECAIALAGVHQFELVELVVNDRGLINEVHRCACGAVAFDATADQEAARRPPL